MSPSVSTLVLGGASARDRWKAANAAARAATGDVLLFVPADAVVARDLPARVAVAGDGAARVVLGYLSPAAGSHPLAGVRRPAGAGATDPAVSEFVGQALAVPAELFRVSGGFAEDLGWGEEADLVFRLLGAGARTARLDGPAGLRTDAVTAGQVARERVAAGRGSVALYRRTPAMLPHLELGGFHAGSPPGLRLRRRLLELGGPPVPPVPRQLLPSRSGRDRWLRFQFDYHYWRGAGQVMRGEEWEGLLRPPVILMYHAIGRPGEPAGRYIIPVARFRRQMRWLALRGYRVIGLEELLEYRRAFRPAPPRSVVITFDDGYADNAELAVPVLHSFGFRGTFFVVSEAIGEWNGWDRRGELAGRAMISREAARAMVQSGMEVGAHTRTHPVLPELSDERVADELGGSRQDLEDALDLPTRTFAYPFGRFDDRIAAAVAAAGFEGACCSRSGPNDPVVPTLRLRRVEVRGTDSLLRFARSVRRGWVARRHRT